MIVDIILGAAVLASLLFLIEQRFKYENILGRLSVLALNVKELDDLHSELDKKIEQVDQSCGRSLFKMKKEFDEFKADYGEAAIEEMREAAKSEKAWRDGVQNIMTFGNQFQGRGDNK